jgi:tetratricopeptide (TPR) repeat protein
LAVARHLLAAGDEVAAAELVESEGAEQLRLGRVVSLRELIALMPAEVRDRPGLLVLVGDLALGSGDFASARQAFERAGSDGPVAARLADTLILQGEIAASYDLIGQALAGPLDAELRVRLLLTQAWVAQISGRLDVAEQALQSGVNAAVTESVMAVAARQLSPTFGIIPGAVDHLERFADQARPVLSGGLPSLQVAGLAVVVDVMRGRLDQAMATAEQVLTGYDRFGGAPPVLGFSLAAVRVLAAGPLMAALQPPIDDLVHHAERLTTASFMYPNSWFMIGRAWWLRGQLDQARDARERMGETDDAPPGSAPLIAVNRLSLTGLIAAAEGDHRRAERALRAAVDAEDTMRITNIYGSARIRLAYVHALSRRPEDALAVAESGCCARSCRSAHRARGAGAAAAHGRGDQQGDRQGADSG